jgi:hypothetical protein
MPRHNRRPQRSKRTHYWQKHHLPRKVEERPDEEPQEILISVAIMPHNGKHPNCISTHAFLTERDIL